MKKSRILCLVLALVMCLSLVACGGNNDGTEPSETNGNEQTEPPATEPQKMSDLNKQESIDVAAHEERSVEAYEKSLNTFMDYYNDALAEVNSSVRIGKMAIAEAKLLEAAVATPYENNAGAYYINRIIPHTITSASWGYDGDMRGYSGYLIADRFLTPAERSELTAKWSELKGTGTWLDYVKQWAADNGITLADSYTRNSNSNDEPTTWDYLSSSKTADGQTLSGTWDGLLRYDTEDVQQPAAAESWEVSEDGLTYTFHIRPGIKWVTYQGTEVAELKADDYVAGLQHAADTQGGLSDVVNCIVNLTAYLNGEVTDFAEVGVKAIDDYTLQYTLSAPTPWFPTVAGYSALAPLCRSYYESQGGKFGTDYDSGAADYLFGSDSQHIVYFGPYLVSNYTAQNTIVLTANPTYWDAENVQIKTVTLKYAPDGDDLFAWNNVIAGTFNGGCGLNTSALEQAKSTKVPDDPDGLTYFDKYAYVVTEDMMSFVNFVNLNRYAYANYNDETQVVSTQTPEDAERTHAALQNKNFRLAIALGNDRATVNAIQVGDDLKYAALTNSYVPGSFIAITEDISIDINGTATSFPAGTYYGEILQAVITSDGYPMKVWDPEGNDGAGSSFGFDGWYLPEEAAKYMDKAVEELAAEGIEISAENPIQLDMIYRDYSTIGSGMDQAKKQALEAALGNRVQVNLMAVGSSTNASYAGYYGEYGYQMNYDFGGNTGWGPDYGDPQTFLDTMIEQGYMTYAMGLF